MSLICVPESMLRDIVEAVRRDNKETVLWWVQEALSCGTVRDLGDHPAVFKGLRGETMPESWDRNDNLRERFHLGERIRQKQLADELTQDRTEGPGEG